MNKELKLETVSLMLQQKLIKDKIKEDKNDENITLDIEKKKNQNRK